MKNDDVQIAMKTRQFMPIEQLEQLVDKAGLASSKSFFTVGVIVENSKPIVSKSGKQFSVMKVSDMYKYDMIKAR